MPRSDPITVLDGCPTCGDRSAVSASHRERCTALAAARKAAAQVDGALSAVAVDDLFAHLTSPRFGGPMCDPAAAVDVIRTLSALGWRPTIARR